MARGKAVAPHSKGRLTPSSKPTQELSIEDPKFTAEYSPDTRPQDLCCNISADKTSTDHTSSPVASLDIHQHSDPEPERILAATAHREAVKQSLIPLNRSRRAVTRTLTSLELAWCDQNSITMSSSFKPPFPQGVFAIAVCIACETVCIFTNAPVDYHAQLRLQSDKGSIFPTYCEECDAARGNFWTRFEHAIESPSQSSQMPGIISTRLFGESLVDEALKKKYKVGISDFDKNCPVLRPKDWWRLTLNQIRMEFYILPRAPELTIVPLSVRNPEQRFFGFHPPGQK